MENLDLAEVCRICLTKHIDMHLALDVGVVDRLLECASVRLPPESLVCEFCKCEVDKWYSFKQQVLKSMEVARYIEDYHKRREKPVVENYAVIEEYFVKVEVEDEVIEVEDEVIEVEDEVVEEVEVKPEIIELEDPLTDDINLVIKEDEEVDTPPETSTEITYKCDICEKVLSSYYALCCHKKLHTKFFKSNTPPPEEEHSDSPSPPPPPEAENKIEDDKKYQCDLCHKSFISKNGIMWHKQLHSALKLGLSKDAERSPCPCCPMVYEKRSSLVDHMRWKHNRSMKKAKYNSKPKYDYKVNLRPYKGEKQKPYKCDICKKSFMKFGNFTAHCKIHSKDNLFICNDCGKGFKRQRDLLNHQLKHISERRDKLILEDNDQRK